MSGVYRSQAIVPPEPPYASILSPFRRAHRAAPPDLDDAPTWSVPLWNELEPSPGLPAPPRPAEREELRALPRPRGVDPGVVVALTVAAVVLAALSLVAYRRYLASAHSGEARAVIQSIRAGEESYRAETLTYLGCGSSPGAGSLLARYPRAVPDGGKTPWINPSHPDFGCWRRLSVAADGPVRYSYAVAAGPPGAAPPTIPGLSVQPQWPSPTREPWYVVVAVGDVDGDGTQSMFVASSFNGEIYAENEGE